MRIHAIHVEPRGEARLGDVLTHIESLSLRRRLQTVSGTPMRLESVNRSGRFWLLDFALIRPNGPGRAASSAPIVDFDLNADEGFGEETAALYDPRSNYMSLQYNHFGPRQARIEAYLNRFASALDDDHEESELGFDLDPVLTADAADRLSHMQIVKSIEATIHVPGIAARPESRRRSLSSLLEVPVVGHAQTVSIQVSAGRRRHQSLSIPQVRRAISELLGMRDDVRTLSIVAKESEDGPREPIDFLEARLEMDIELRAIDRGRRYPLEERIAVLRQAFDLWREQGHFDHD
ncbi:MAG: DUF6731 family protein [Reyranellaceae bacterium]